MARRRSKSILSSPLVKYGLYAAVAYYGWQWWQNRQAQAQLVATGVIPPPAA